MRSLTRQRLNVSAGNFFCEFSRYNTLQCRSTEGRNDKRVCMYSLLMHFCNVPKLWPNLNTQVSYGNKNPRPNSRSEETDVQQ